MIDKIAILNSIHGLDIIHRNDGDGGYELVHKIRELVSSFDEESKGIFWNVLLELVEHQDKTMWGVALETLVQENPDQVAEKLSHIFNASHNDNEWKDQLVLAMLRLAYQPAAPKCVEYISASLQNGRRAVLPLLAALCRVDTGNCIKISSEYFSRILQSIDLIEKHEGYIPAFVRYFLKVDEHLLCQLVEQTKKLKSTSGKQLAVMFYKCLARPSFVREIGKSKVDSLREELGNMM